MIAKRLVTLNLPSSRECRRVIYTKLGSQIKDFSYALNICTDQCLAVLQPDCLWVNSSLETFLPPLQAQLGTGQWWADVSPLSAPVRSSLPILQVS